MTITLTKGHKWIVIVGGLLAISANVGTWIKVPGELKELKQAHAKDHDTLTRVEEQVKQISRMLVNKGNYENTNKADTARYQSVLQSSTSLLASASRVQK